MTSQSGANQWEWLHIDFLNYLGYPCGFIFIYIVLFTPLQYTDSESWLHTQSGEPWRDGTNTSEAAGQ